MRDENNDDIKEKKHPPPPLDIKNAHLPSKVYLV